jgi:hypothetical protein
MTETEHERDIEWPVWAMLFFTLSDFAEEAAHHTLRTPGQASSFSEIMCNGRCRRLDKKQFDAAHRVGA